MILTLEDKGRKRVMQFKLTKLEKAWILHDVGNSAFILMVSTIIPIYFNYLAGVEVFSAVDYLVYGVYAASYRQRVG